MSPRVVPDDEPIWRALADPTRRAILDALRSGPRTTIALTERFPTTRFAVMKHLAVLVEAGLVTVERRGRKRLNHLNPVPLQQTYERWVRPVAASAAGVALRLAERAEGPMQESPVQDGPAQNGPAQQGGPGRQDGHAVIPYGLDIRARHAVHADRDRTWEALLELADWWPQCWPDGARLVFEPHLGGRLGTCFGPSLDDGGRGALWGVVSALDPGRELRVDGSMDIPGPVVGQWRMLLEDEGAGTTVVTVEHRVLGRVDDETAGCFTRGWPGTLARLAERAESTVAAGSTEGARP